MSNITNIYPTYPLMQNEVSSGDVDLEFPQPIIVDGLPNPNLRLRKFIGLSILAPIVMFVTVVLYYLRPSHNSYCRGSPACVIFHIYPWIDVLITSGCLIAIFNVKGTIHVSIFLIQLVLGGLTAVASFVFATLILVEGISLIRHGMTSTTCYDACGLYFFFGGLYILLIAIVFCPAFAAVCWIRCVAVYNSKVLRRSE